MQVKLPTLSAVPILARIEFGLPLAAILFTITGTISSGTTNTFQLITPELAR